MPLPRPHAALSSRVARLLFSCCAQASLERHEPFPMRKEFEASRSDMFMRQSQRAWSQDIVFLPPTVAARERSVARERSDKDYLEGIAQVYALQ